MRASYLQTFNWQWRSWSVPRLFPHQWLKWEWGKGRFRGRNFAEPWGDGRIVPCRIMCAFARPWTHPGMSCYTCPTPSFRDQRKTFLFGLRPAFATPHFLYLHHPIYWQSKHLPPLGNPSSPTGMWFSLVTQIRQAKAITYLYEIDTFPKDTMIVSNTQLHFYVSFVNT